jgi:hypothetical protein
MPPHSMGDLRSSTKMHIFEFILFIFYTYSLSNERHLKFIDLRTIFDYRESISKWKKFPFPVGVRVEEYRIRIRSPWGLIGFSRMR